MPLVQPPVDFKALRTALVDTLAAAVGLPASQVIYQEQELTDAPRPAYPYIGILVVEAAGMLDGDFYLPVVDDPASPTGLFTYYGRRMLTVSLDTYAATHRTAYALGATLQAMLQQIPTRDALSAAGLTVQSVGSVQDISELLNTGWEGRSQLDATFSYITQMAVDMGRMDTVQVSGQVDELPPDDFTVEETA